MMRRQRYNLLFFEPARPDPSTLAPLAGPTARDVVRPPADF
jgi:hypothetical protein